MKTKLKKVTDEPPPSGQAGQSVRAERKGFDSKIRDRIIEVTQHAKPDTFDPSRWNLLSGK